MEQMASIDVHVAGGSATATDFRRFELLRRQYPCSCMEWGRGPFVTLAIECEDHGDHVTVFEDDLDAMDQASDVLSGRLKL